MSRAFLIPECLPTCDWVFCNEVRHYTLYKTCEMNGHPIVDIGAFCEKHAQKKLDQYADGDTIYDACERGVHATTFQGKRRF